METGPLGQFGERGKSKVSGRRFRRFIARRKGSVLQFYEVGTKDARHKGRLCRSAVMGLLRGGGGLSITRGVGDCTVRATVLL